MSSVSRGLFPIEAQFFPGIDFPNSTSLSLNAGILKVKKIGAVWLSVP